MEKIDISSSTPLKFSIDEILNVAGRGQFQNVERPMTTVTSFDEQQKVHVPNIQNEIDRLYGRQLNGPVPIYSYAMLLEPYPQFWNICKEFATSNFTSKTCLNLVPY